MSTTTKTKTEEELLDEQNAQNNGVTNSGTNGQYTMGDVENVVNGAPTEPVVESAYDKYMRMATEEYEKQKAQNEQNAVNQAASAGAQYREVERNVNELNKLNGRANTGYVGDTSIYAYNAYRNSVNDAYAQASQANNSLYSYYLQTMADLQAKKDSKELSDVQLEMNKQQLDFQKEEFDFQKEQFKYQQDENEYTKYKNWQNDLDGIMEIETDPKTGTITNESAKRLYEWTKSYFGGEINSKVMAELMQYKGFSEWLEQHELDYITPENKEQLQNIIKNIETAEDWTAAYENAVSRIEEMKDKLTEEEYQELMEKVGAYNPSTSNAKWSLSGIGSGRKYDDFKLTINGVEYDLQTGDEVKEKDLKATLNKLATGREDETPSTKDEGALRIKGASSDSTSKAGKVVVHEGNMYIYTKKGWVKVESDNSSVNKAIRAYLTSSAKENRPKSELVSEITGKIDSAENYDNFMKDYETILKDMDYYKEKLGEEEYNKLSELLNDKKYNLATEKMESDITELSESKNFLKDYNKAIKDLEGLKGNIGEEEYNKLSEMLDEYEISSSGADWNIKGLGSGRENDDVDIKINGKTYDLQTGKKVEDSQLKKALNKLATGQEDETPSVKNEGALRTKGASSDSTSKAGKLVVHEGKMYLYTKNGWVNVKGDRGSVNSAINAYLASARANYKTEDQIKAEQLEANEKTKADITNKIESLESSNNFIKDYEKVIKELENNKSIMSDEEYSKLSEMLDEYENTSNSADWSIKGIGTGRKHDDVDITINGNTYDLQCGEQVKDKNIEKALNELATGYKSKPPSSSGEAALRIKNNSTTSEKKAGKLLVYEGKMYLYTISGWVNVVGDRGSVTKAINAYLKNARAKKGNE